jgi:translation initiation factor 2B subunit (eIF-2B alpha/beta/delta family)
MCVNICCNIQIGSFTMAVCARAMNKPVYALAESIKFITQYPLNQHDVPDVFKVFRFAILYYFNIHFYSIRIQCWHLADRWTMNIRWLIIHHPNI